MNHANEPDRTEPGTSEEFDEQPPGGACQPSSPARQWPGKPTPDKEGGAPVDDLDLDGDGLWRQWAPRVSVGSG